MLRKPSPGLFIILWNIQFECLHLGDDNRCQNYEGRPRVCRDYVCSTVDTESYTPSQNDLIALNAILDGTDWSSTAKTKENFERVI